jgi:WD40 repeat protein
MVQDGYLVTTNRREFSDESLEEVDLLVIGATAPHDLTNSVVFSPDGTTLVGGGADRTISLWNVSTGGLKDTYRDTAWIGALAFAPDGRTLAAAAADESVKLWRVPAGSVRAVLEHGTAVRSVSFSPDGTSLVSSGDDGTVRVWDSETGRRIKTLIGHDGPVLHVAFSPDGSALATAGADGSVLLWDLEAETVVATLAGHRGPVRHVVFSPTGHRLASAGADATVKLWDSQTGLLLTTLAEEAQSLAFSPDGAMLATGREETIGLWVMPSGESLGILDVNVDVAWSLEFSPDGALLAWVDDDEIVQIWDRRTDRTRHVLDGRTDAIWDSGPALTPEECGAVLDWVSGGGALLLITDHAPWATPSRCLAAGLGVTMSNANATEDEDPDHNSGDGNPSWLVFSRNEGLIGDHPVTRGRTEEERVDEVVTFAGQSLVAENDFTPFLILSPTAVDHLEGGRVDSAAGHAQGVAGTFGLGRVVVLGEAMMFMGPGLDSPDYDNRQLALNVVRWLSGRLN